MFVSSRPALSPRLLFQEVSTCELPYPFTAEHKLYACRARALVHHAITRLVDGRRRVVLAPEGIERALVDVLRGAGAEVHLFRVDRRLSADLEDLERLATGDVCAVIVHHALGWPEGQVDAITRLCRDRALVLVEDGALFTEHRGRPAGAFGELAWFDLGRVLPVPAGALLVARGGATAIVDALTAEAPAPCVADGVPSKTLALVLDALELDAEWVGRGLRRFRAAVERAAEHLLAEVIEPGSDATTLCALSALTRHILERIDYDRIAERRRILHALFHQRLADRVATIERDGFDGAAPDGFPILVRDRDLALGELRARGVAAVPAFGASAWCRTSDVSAIAAQGVLLPLHQDLTLEHVEHVAWAVADAGPALAPPRGPRRVQVARAPVIERTAAGR